MTDLVSLIRSWNPRSMRSTQDGADLLDALNAAAADALQPLIDFEGYLPIILNPTRCLDNDVDRSLNMNGVNDDGSLSVAQARRLAIIAQSMRAWRGSFRSLRSVIGALTGGPVVVRSWIMERVIVDSSTWDMLMLGSEYENTTQVFVLGQGPSSIYDAEQVERYVSSMARTVLDLTDVVPCYAITAWRDGIAGWAATCGFELVASDTPNEYESLDIGPEVSTGPWRLVAPTHSDADYTGLWATVWFMTQRAADNDRWRVLIAWDGVAGYVIECSVGNHELRIIRNVAGVDTVLLTQRTNIPNSASAWHRLDFTLTVVDATHRHLRAYIDHNPSGLAMDVMVTPPSGTGVSIVSNLSAGRLRLAAITAQEST